MRIMIDTNAVISALIKQGSALCHKGLGIFVFGWAVKLPRNPLTWFDRHYKIKMQVNMAQT